MPTTSTTVTSALLLVCLSLVVSSSQAQTFQETQALVDLFNSANGTAWNNNGNWNTGEPCANNWFGVTCDANNTVVKLELSGNNLAGDLSSSLRALYGLNLLDLSANSLTDQIPDIFDSFPSLTSLDFSGNQFSGSIPPTVLNNLSNCGINLSTNQLTSIPWGQWTNKLALGKSSLILRDNSLSGTLSHQIYWANSVYLDDNDFAGPLPEIDNRDKGIVIEQFSVQSNKLSGNLPVSLTQVTGLNYLEVSNNYAMTGEIPLQYASMPNLKTLNFFVTTLTCPLFSNQWDTFQGQAHTSCPVIDLPSGNNNDDDDTNSPSAWVIALFVVGFVMILALSAAVVFLFVKSRKKYEVVDFEP